MSLGQDISNWLARREAEAEALLVRALKHQLGPSWAIRYFRNPNPLVTIRLLRSLGAQIGANTVIKGSLFFDNVYEDPNSTWDFSHLKIGSNCYIGDGVFFDLANEVVLGNDVVVSARVSFATHADSHRSRFVDSHFPRRCEPIIVGDGAWIALGATVLAGVEIGAQCVVAANSVVRDKTRARTLNAGIPAREIRSLSNGARDGQ